MRRSDTARDLHHGLWAEMFGTAIPLVGLLTLVLLGFTIATIVNTFAMEAAVLFVPAFLFLFPVLVPGFPDLATNGAIGLALYVELFGYSSSVAAYWYRHQIDFNVAGKLLVLTIPAAVLARTVSYAVPSTLLMIGFGVLLVALSLVLYEAHEHGPSIVDAVAEKPELSLLSVLHTDYEPRTRVLSDRHDASETPPSETMGGAAETPAERSNSRALMGDGDDTTAFHMEPPDVLITLGGGTLAGLVGIAIGELTQTMLAIRRRVPLALSTGTAALVLHATIVAALVTNVGLLTFAPSLTSGLSVPFVTGSFVAAGCVVGGQAGAYLNNRLPESTVMVLLIVVYAAVGLFVLVRTIVYGGGAH
ncbi:sulfite exporter TauE/SafE family protein [Halorhabdus amylolytica]|uniref:sulfite exporter TauE/SafE family protein n=1 Tax=Halorhabdus amylolytica TaxID=2559573 RepID=UPI0010AA08AA|nr:sulfite exporter TauE/SafE family protein [Halorhabdus amylolytica]